MQELNTYEKLLNFISGSDDTTLTNAAYDNMVQTYKEAQNILPKGKNIFKKNSNGVGEIKQSVSNEVEQITTYQGEATIEEMVAEVGEKQILSTKKSKKKVHESSKNQI